MGKKKLESNGSAFQRIQAGFLTGLLTLLLIWFLGFLRYDVADLEGPSRQDFIDELDTAPQDKLDQLVLQRTELERELRRNSNLQKDYQASKENARQVMEEISALHRLSIEQGVAPPEEDVTALASARSRVLTAQDSHEKANISVTESNSTLIDLQESIHDQRGVVQEHNEPAYEKFDKANDSHRFKLAIFRLGIPLPLFILAAWLVRKNRKNTFRLIYLAGLLATFWEVGVIAFNHFPREYFKYIAIGTAILIVGLFLKFLLRNLSTPPKDLLIKRYRAAYEQGRCAICDFPIRRGLLREAVWGKQGPKVPTVGSDGLDRQEKPYTCPSCATGLFSECDSCHGITHSLLPCCENCGVDTPVASLSDAT